MPGDQPLPPAPISIPTPSPSAALPSWLGDAPDEPRPMPTPIVAEPVIETPIEPPVVEEIVATEPITIEPVESIEQESVVEEIPAPAPIVSTEPTIQEMIEQAEQEPITEELPAPIIAEPIVETIPTPVAQSAFASMPPPPPPEELSHDEEPTVVLPLAQPEPTALPFASSEQVEWDWRLDALGVVVEPASVKPGQTYWRLVRADYEAPNESNDEHQIYFTVIDQQNRPIEYQKVLQGWADGETDAITNDQGIANIPMWVAYAPDRMEQGPYSAWIDGMPCDGVRGMGLPSKRHVNFRLTWKRSAATFLDTERRR